MEWQPIETAPRDGTHFLAFEVIGPMDEEDEGGRIIRRGFYERQCVVAYHCFGSVVPYPWNGSFVRNRSFTHWQPLPPPPQDHQP